MAHAIFVVCPGGVSGSGPQPGKEMKNRYHLPGPNGKGMHSGQASSLTARGPETETPLGHQRVRIHLR
jgi:hypothetical protein